MEFVRLVRQVKSFPPLLRDAYRDFQQNDPLRMAAATSFFSSFALPPIMIILIEVFGIFGNSRNIRHDLFAQLSIALDRSVALQVRDIMKNLNYRTWNPGMKAAGFLFLLFVASTLFEVIKNSLNQLWRVRLKKRKSIFFLLLHRAKSIGIIIIAGILFTMVFLGDAQGWLLPERWHGAVYRIVSMAVVMIWFILILRYLSFARPDWKTVVAGGVFTGLLFTIGEMLLHVLLSYNNIKTIYGASTSLVLLLLFVFYCSFIFYFGACFTQALAVRSKRPFALTPDAVRYTLRAEEVGRA